MRVAFICPGYENLGLEYLSAVLIQDGVETRLFLDPILFAESNLINNSILSQATSFRKRLLRAIKQFDPQIVCFSVISDNYRWACEWASEVRKIVSAKIVFGGIHPTSSPEDVIRSVYVDYVCIGEGEYALRDLVRSLSTGSNGADVLNIWSKDGDKIIRNGMRPLIDDLDELPFPDKELFYNSHPIFGGAYLIMTSRGCSYSCKYCCNNVYHQLYGLKGSKVRRRSVARVIEELALAKKKYSPRHVLFADDLFNSDPKWLKVFLKEYAHRIRLPFACYVFPDLIDENLAVLLKEAGCFKVQMGLQVFDAEKRKKILGRASLQSNIANAIAVLRRNNIYVVCDTIFGFPQEQESELVDLATFYAQYPPDHCENFWLRYYPKTEITQWAFEHGYIDKMKKVRIERGEGNFGLLKSSEHSYGNSYARQIMLLLSLYPFMSLSLKLWILRKRAYRYLPLLPMIGLYIVIRILHHSKFDFNTERTWKRYLYFLPRVLCSKIPGPIHGAGLGVIGHG